MRWGRGAGGGDVFVYCGVLRGIWSWLFEENDAGSCGKYLPLEKQSAIIRWFILFFIEDEDIDEGLRLIFNSGDMTIYVLSSETCSVTAGPWTS